MVNVPSVPKVNSITEQLLHVLLLFLVKQESVTIFHYASLTRSWSMESVTVIARV